MRGGGGSWMVVLGTFPRSEECWRRSESCLDVRLARKFARESGLFGLLLQCAIK